MNISKQAARKDIAIASEGGAFFIDILGVSDLTRGKIPITLDDISEIAEVANAPQKSIHQYLSVYLLTTFRNTLAHIKKSYPKINITQLSDCAFLWSNDLKSLVVALSKLMFMLVKKGILCRGGLGYGEILVPSNDDNEKLGRFVMGSSVTNAATFEKLGKGCRIFTHPDFAREFGNLYRNSIFYQFLFYPHTIPTDYSCLDEFRWYLLPSLEILEASHIFPSKEAKKAVLQSADLVCTLMHSSQMKWVILNEHGIVHTAASIEAITYAMAQVTGDMELLMHADIAREAIRNRSDSVASKRLKILKGQINKIDFNAAHPEINGDG